MAWQTLLHTMAQLVFLHAGGPVPNRRLVFPSVNRDDLRTVLINERRLVDIIVTYVLDAGGEVLVDVVQSKLLMEHAPLYHCSVGPEWRWTHLRRFVVGPCLVVGARSF